MRFTIHIDSSDVGNLPDHVKHQVMHDLPRKLTREAKRIMWAETSLAQQKREFANWQEIDSNRPEMSWPDELDVRKAMDAQRDAIHNYQPGRKSK